MLCSLYESKGPCVSLSYEVGSTFAISSYFQNKNVFYVVQFHIVTLFFDFSPNFLKYLLAMHYVVCPFFSA